MQHAGGWKLRSAALTKTPVRNLVPVLPLQTFSPVQALCMACHTDEILPCTSSRSTTGKQRRVWPAALTRVHISGGLPVLPLAHAGALGGALGVALFPPGGLGGSPGGDRGVAHRQPPLGVVAGGALCCICSQGEGEGVASVRLHAQPHPCRLTTFQGIEIQDAFRALNDSLQLPHSFGGSQFKSSYCRPAQQAGSEQVGEQTETYLHHGSALHPPPAVKTRSSSSSSSIQTVRPFLRADANAELQPVYALDLGSENDLQQQAAIPSLCAHTHTFTAASERCPE